MKYKNYINNVSWDKNIIAIKNLSKMDPIESLNNHDSNNSWFH